MAPTLLTLPRELRDQIYAYILISPLPTPLIEALPYRSTSHTSSTSTGSSTSSRYKICLNPISPCTTSTSTCTIKSNPEPNPKSNPKSKRNTKVKGKPLLTTLSIRRTCRQIHTETHGLLWTHNTLLFSRIDGSDMGVVRVLKAMGQGGSRQVVSVRIVMPCGFANRGSGSGSGGGAQVYSSLPKIMNLLASRARHGAFRRLEVVWGREAFLGLVAGVGGDGGERVMDRVLVGLLEGLGRGNEEGWERQGVRCGFERVMWVPDVEGGLEAVGRRRARDLVREMLFAFGGQVVWGGRCIGDWRDV